MSVRSSITCGTKSYFGESDADDAVDACLLCHYGPCPTKTAGELNQQVWEMRLVYYFEISALILFEVFCA